MVASVNASMTRGCRNAQDRLVSYRDKVQAKTRSHARYSTPWGPAGSDFSSLAHIMGVVVSDRTSEITMAVESTTANSRNRRPTMPPIKRIGRNTAISERLMDRTVNEISFAPRSAASMGGTPCSRYRLMFSRTTMASSTTNPVAIVSAMRERLSRL